MREVSLHDSAGVTRMYDEQRLRRTCSSYMRDIHVSRTFVGGAYGRLFAGLCHGLCCHQRACSSYMREVSLHDSAGMTNKGRFQTCLNTARMYDEHSRGTFTL